jgi:hypothetical protein
MKRLKLICGLALALLTGLAAQPALAQRQHGGAAPSHAPSMRAAPRPAAPARPNARTGGQRAGAYRPGVNARAPQNQARPQGNAGNGGNQNRAGADNRALAGQPPGVRQNLREMSPQEQQRYLQNYERFKSLPPQQQAQIRRNLGQWKNLSPAEQDRLTHSAQIWRNLSPQQRQYVQNNLAPKWERMSPERKQIVTGRLHTLREMSPAERQAALNDPQFMRGLSPDEQSVLRGLDSISPARP